MTGDTVTEAGFEAWLQGRILMHAEKEWYAGRFRLKYTHRLQGNAMGRFGGGWNWSLGIQAGASTVILNLLVASLRVTRSPLCAECGLVAHGPRNAYAKFGGEWDWYHIACRDRKNEEVTR